MEALIMKMIFWNVSLLLWILEVHCSITGISYMDPIKMSSMKNKLIPGTDPCNPLYWYPRRIPDFCKSSTITPPNSEEPSTADLPPSPQVLIPMPPPLSPILPAPVPILPPPVPIMPPPVPILPPAYPILSPPISILPMPSPSVNVPTPPLPLVFPNSPPPSMVSISSNQYSFPNLNSVSSPNLLSYYQSLTGLVPGIRGLVTKDGGINIMPFSDVYADMLETHKNKMVRRKLLKLLDKYEYNPYSRDYKTLRKYEKYFTDDE